jgi:hypothetical protein
MVSEVRYLIPPLELNATLYLVASSLAEKGGRAGAVGCLLYFYGLAFGLLFFLFGDGDV